MRALKRISIILGAVIALILISGGLYGLKMQSEKNKMNSMDTGKVLEEVYTIENDSFVNMFILKSNDSYIAIDAGSNKESTKADLDRLGVDPSSVSAVFLTHTDSDHVASLELFENAKVYISSAEEQMINGKTARAMSLFRNKINRVYEKVEHQQVVDVESFKIKGILNPGHTPGSMSYVINDKYLFIGDAFSLKDGKADGFNEFFNMDSDTAAKSIRLLAGLSGIEYIFTGHYGYTDNFQRAFENLK